MSTQINPSAFPVNVTPSDTADIRSGQLTKGFRVGTTAGDVSVVDGSGANVVIPNVQIGERIDVVTKRINSTGTTAVGITAFF